MLRLLVYALCFASGLAGLTYEVIWLRLLAAQLGNASFATAAVLAAMMGGMGAGALAIGKLGDRRAPLALYGLTELALGLVALAIPSAIELLGGLAVPALRASGPGAIGVALRFAIACAVLFVPAFLMGGSVPLLVRFLQLRGGSVGASTGAVYALNTAGAALGCALAGYVLLGQWGVRATGATAAGVDVAVGLIALGAARFVPRARASFAPAATAVPLDASLGARLPLGIAFAAGLFVLALEGAWTRLLTIAAGHDVHAFASMLAATLLSLALGAFLYRALPARARRSPRLVPALLALGGTGAIVALAIVGHLALARGADVLGLARALALTRSHELSMVQHAVFAALLVAPPAIASGALLPALSARTGSGPAGARVGRVLAANTLGSIAGAFLGPLALIPLFGLASTFVALAALPVGLAAFVLARARRWALASLVVALLPLALLAVPPELPRRMLAQKIGPAHLRFELYEEGATATVAVVRNEIHGERTLYLNGINEVTTRLVHDESFSTLGHLGALLHPRPADVLVICLGGGISAGAVSQHPDVERITIVDLERSVAHATRRFEALNHGVLDDPRVELVIDDGRNHLRTTDRRYDVMVIDSTHPRAVDSWILYTREMYETSRARLAEGGWMVQWVPLHGSSVDEMRILARTFLDVFPTGSLWINAGFEPYGHAGYLLFVGQRGDGRIDPRTIAARIAAPAVARDLDRWGLGSVEEILETFVAGPAAIDRWTRGAPINLDDRPLTQFITRHSDGPPMDVAVANELLEPIAPQLASPADPALDAALARRRSARGLLYAGRLARAAAVCGHGCAKYGGYRRALATGRDYYRRLADRYPRDAGRLVEVGASLVEIGHVGDGVAVLERAAAVDPEHPRVWLSLGVARASAGDDDGAERALRRALALEPDLVLARVALALALDRQGRGAEAVPELFRALARDASLPEIHAALGHVLMRRPGETPRAEEHLRRALALEPRHAGAAVSLARLLLATDRPTYAIEVLRRARRYHPYDTDLAYTLGVAHAQAGDPDAAARSLRRVLHVDPRDAEARAALAELSR